MIPGSRQLGVKWTSTIACTVCARLAAGASEGVDKVQQLLRGYDRKAFAARVVNTAFSAKGFLSLSSIELLSCNDQPFSQISLVKL